MGVGVTSDGSDWLSAVAILIESEVFDCPFVEDIVAFSDFSVCLSVEVMSVLEEDTFTSDVSDVTDSGWPAAAAGDP